MTGLDRITEKIISEARADAAVILDKAREKCAEIMFAASEEAEEIKAELEEKASKNAESIIAAAKSASSMQKRNVMLGAKTDEVEAVFGEAYKELLGLPEEKYCALTAKLISDSLTAELENEKTNIELYGEEEAALPEKYELVLNKNDREKYSDKILSELERITIGKLDRSILSRIFVAEDTADIDGGVILRFGDTECNCSLETVFSETKRRLEGEIYGLLFSDKEQNDSLT